MREIKSRGKRIDNGEWAYGYYVKVMDREGDDIDLICSPDTSYPRIDGKWYIEDSTEVDWKTVGQYTGLKDKAGTEIYEGDIIRECVVEEVIWDGQGIVRACPCGNVVIGSVYTDINKRKRGRAELTRDGTLGEKGKMVDLNMSVYDGLYTWPKGIEVIGNIHENKELLNDSK